MGNKILKLLCNTLFASLVITQLAQADSVTDSIKQKVTKNFKSEVLGVEKTPFEGVYEVRLPDSIIYTNPQVDYVMVGNLVDVKSHKDLTGPRLEAFNAVSLDSLPLAKAVKRTMGKGEHRIVTFEDPNCIYCKKLASELGKLDNVTIYTVVIPILSPDSVVKTKNILCAADKTSAWLDWMERNKVPADADCDVPIAENLKAVKKLGIRGTPVLFFENGRRLSGYAPIELIKETMNEASL